MGDGFFKDGLNRGQVDDAALVVLEAVIAFKITIQGHLDLGYDRGKHFQMITNFPNWSSFASYPSC
jgi:hypothetical protein